MRRTPEERFWAMVEKTDSCWLWKGAQAGRGWKERLSYGVFGLSAGNNVYAHRYAWELLVGPIPEAMTLDHLCQVKKCVNPSHLEVVTQAVNTRRFFAQKPKVASCHKGHPYTEGNVTYWGTNPSPRCLTCSRERYYRTYPLVSGKRKPRKHAA